MSHHPSKNGGRRKYFRFLQKKTLYNTPFCELTHNYHRRTYVLNATYYTKSRKKIKYLRNNSNCHPYNTALTTLGLKKNFPVSVRGALVTDLG